MSFRAVTGIFGSKDRHVLGAFRIMPFESRGSKWRLLPTIVLGKMRVAKGVFPLRSDPADEASIQRCTQHGRLFSVQAVKQY